MLNFQLQIYIFFRLQAPELDLDQFAWLTPLKGDISEECLAASIQYVDTFVNLSPELTSIPGPISMFDSNGKLPLEGFLSDTIDMPIDICQGDENCIYSLPDQLRYINAKIPVGYNINPGNFDECLEIDNFETAYCVMAINGPQQSGRSSLLKLGSYLTDLDDKLTRFDIIDKFKNLPLNTESRQISMDLPSIRSYASELAFYNISVTTDRLYLSMMSAYAIIASPKIGMCFPKACTVEDVNTNFANLTSNSHLPIEVTINIEINGTLMNFIMELPSSEVTINTGKCYTSDNVHGAPQNLPFAYIFFYILFSIIFALVILGTLSELVLKFVLKKKSPDTLLVKIIHSYSIYSNGKRLLSTESVGKDHLDCMNGMRFLSMTWVALGHSFIGSQGAVTRNTEAALKIYNGETNFALEVILNALPSVDSFFLMSGTLTTYIFLKELERAGNNPIKHTVTLVMYYLHRYLRLTIPYVLIMGVVISVLPYVYQGPGWNWVILESEQCQKNWWKHFLYIHTLVEDNQSDFCMGVTWYLVDDMMFHVFSPIVIYPMYFLYKMTKKHVWTVLFWVFSLACFTFGVFYISYTTEQIASGVESDRIHTHYLYHVTFYFAPWTRYQAYLVGIILGYILHNCRGKTIKIRDDVNIFAWQAAFLAAFAVVYGLHQARQTHNMSLFSATMYNTFQRLAWNGALAWVIFSCAKGYGGIINEFLSWPAFAPLSRLTFCTYLIHQNVITMFFKTVMSSFPNDFEMFTSVWYYLAIQFISCVIAFWFALIFEVPATRAEKLIVDAILGIIIKPEVKQHVNIKSSIIKKTDDTSAENFKDKNVIEDDGFVEKQTQRKDAIVASDRNEQAEFASTDCDKSAEKNNETYSADSITEEPGSIDGNLSNGIDPPSYDQLMRDADAIQRA